MSKSFQEWLAEIQTDVANAETVVGGVLTLVQGIPGLIMAAVEQAHAITPLNPSQKAVFENVSTALVGQGKQLASAVASAPSGNVTAGEGVTSPAPMTGS